MMALRHCAGALALAATLVAITGCGKKPTGDDAAVATVGDRPVTVAYYKQMLAKMKPEQLPRDANGEFANTESIEGKRLFLDVLVNKELMVAKAIQMGYDKDTDVQQGLTQLKTYLARDTFWQDEVGDPANFVSDADVEHYYSRLGEKRNCDFVVCDFEDDARAARDAARAGASWDEVKAKYHSPNADPKRATNIDVPWGQFTDDFEREVFAVQEGGITEPIPTPYGYWVMRVNKITQEPKPELDAIRVRVLDSIRKRKINLKQIDLRRQLREKRKYVLDEDALMIVFEGLPADEHLIDPETKQPTRREDLKPLQVDTAHLDRLLFKYELSTGPVEFTVGDYKSRFDEMNVFDRPKKRELIGSLRAKIEADAEKAIVQDEAAVRGYLEDPRVVNAAYRQIEEMLVERVHNELVRADEYVSPAELDSFWTLRSKEFFVPETRSGYMVVCKDAELAATARQTAIDRAAEPNIWKQVNKLYGNDPKLEQEFGRLFKVRADAPATTRGKSLLFSLAQDEISQPARVEGGWAVVKCDTIEAAFQPELKDRSDAVGQYIKRARKDAALTAMLAQWRQEFPVKVNEDLLASMPSHKALTTPDPSVKPVVEKPAAGAA